MEVSSLSSTRTKALLADTSSSQHGVAAAAAHGTADIAAPSPCLPYVRYDVSTMAHVACGCAVVVDNRIGGSATATAAVPLISTSPPVLPPSSCTTTVNTSSTNTDSNIPLDEWRTFTLQLQAIVRPLVRLETAVVTTALPSLFTLAYATPYLLDWMAIPFPYLSSSVPLIFIAWIVVAVTVLVVTIHVERRRLQTWHALQEACSSNDMSANNSLHKQAQLFHALGWSMECHYEWWTTAGRRSMGGANRGFRLYLYPIPTMSALEQPQQPLSSSRNAVMSIHNGYVRIPLSAIDSGAIGGDSPAAVPQLTLGFESLATSAVWVRFWSELQTSTAVVRCCGPLALTLRHIVWSLGGASLLVLATTATLALNGMNYIVLWIGAALLWVAFVVTACISSSQFHKRRHLTSRADYVHDFAQLGYYVEHRTVAYPCTSTWRGCTHGLQFGHYLYIFRLPMWNGGRPAGTS